MYKFEIRFIISKKIHYKEFTENQHFHTHTQRKTTKTHTNHQTKNKTFK